MLSPRLLLIVTFTLLQPGDVIPCGASESGWNVATPLHRALLAPAKFRNQRCREDRSLAT